MNFLKLSYFISLLFLLQVTACDTSKPLSQSNNNNMAQAMDDNKTTIVLVRHAEKQKVEGERDPKLTDAGHERARDLARFLSDLPVTAIYSSDYHRTRDTAKPTADATGLVVNIFDPRDPQTTATEIFSKHKKGVVLVVGHSNSTPTFVNLLMGNSEVEQIDEKDYDNIFIVRANAQGDAEMMHLHYGK